MLTVYLTIVYSKIKTCVTFNLQAQLDSKLLLHCPLIVMLPQMRMHMSC